MIGRRWQPSDNTLCHCSVLPQRQDTVWVASFRPKSANSSYSGYAGLDFQQPSDVRGPLNALQAIVFWGGLHHNVKEVRTYPEGSGPSCGHTKGSTDSLGMYQHMLSCVARSESVRSPCCCLPALQAMDRHGLALERKPEVARVVMDDVAPALRLLQGVLATPPDVPNQHTNSASAPFGGVPDAQRSCIRWHVTFGPLAMLQSTDSCL